MEGMTTNFLFRDIGSLCIIYLYINFSFEGQVEFGYYD